MDTLNVYNNDIKKYLLYLMKRPGELFKAMQSRRVNKLSSETPYKFSDVSVHEIQNNAIKFKNIFSISQTEGKEIRRQEAWTLELAGETLNIDASQNIPWRTVYSDGEAVAALQRFIWFQQLLAKELAAGGNIKELCQYGKGAILSWIQEFMPNGKIENMEECHLEVWQTYSVAERLISWIYCLLFSAEDNLEGEKIVSSIEEQLLFIANHLEYYGEIFTGNHLSNDGRALFIGGCVLQNRGLMDFGQQIMLGEAKRILDNDIFLREGSAHYQFLITRNYTEAMLFAHKYGNAWAEAKLKEIVEKLTEGCKFFLYENSLKEWDIPRIGDISPDCTPEWLLGVPCVAADFLDNKKAETKFPRTAGWHTLICALFGYKKNREEELTNPFMEQGIHCFQDWLRNNKEDWILFAHVNHTCHPYTLGHVHQDSGGVALFHKGRKIIIDTGRKKYLNVNQGGKGKEWLGHSILSVDRHNPLITSRGFYTHKYLMKVSKEAPDFYVEGDLIKIKNHGYERIKGVGCHQRKICMQEETVKISDSVAGKGKHEIIILFHVPYHVQRHGSGYEFYVEGERYLIQFSEEMVNFDATYGSENMLSAASDIYGAEYDISTIVCKMSVELPWHCETIIRYEG